jgi:carbon-monoxide dehydrogenase iron sulfur subunit
MSKALVVEAEKCNGCRLCVKACSQRHDGSDDPARSRIQVDELQGVFMPVVCQQCEDAPCMASCPTSSRSRDEETGRTDIDYKRCIACRTCIAVCPFGASRYDKAEKRVVTCDLCDGDHQCVRVCGPGALKYVEKRDIHLSRQLEAAEKLCGVLMPRSRDGAKA